MSYILNCIPITQYLFSHDLGFADLTFILTVKIYHNKYLV